MVTLCNLQSSGLFRVRDKQDNWNEIKDVSF